MSPNFSRLFPRCDPECMAWADFVYAFLTDELDDLESYPEGTSMRLRRGEHLMAMGPRQHYLSIYFRHPSYIEDYRRASGRAHTGKYTVNLPYFDDVDLPLLRDLVRRALGWQPPGVDAAGPRTTSDAPPTYELFKSMFVGAVLAADDLLLLEAFQIGYLPGWVPEPELGTVLQARPYIHRFLESRRPDLVPFLQRVRDAGTSGVADAELARCEDLVVWTIADLVVYSKCPEAYDGLPFHGWPFSEVTDVVSLEGKTVLDGGSGTGRVALEAARHAEVVYAVEPVGRLRQYVRERARDLHLNNLYVVDGFLDNLPFPEGFADVIITSHALGWRLPDELAELERVVRRPGCIIHCPGTAESDREDPQHAELVSDAWGYECAPMAEADGPKRKYWKHL